MVTLFINSAGIYRFVDGVAILGNKGGWKQQGGSQ